jgi:hypothetical protein
MTGLGLRAGAGLPILVGLRSGSPARRGRLAGRDIAGL